MKFGITYAVSRGRHSSPAENFQQTLEQIQLAEECGFESAFISEHHFMRFDMFPSPLIALAYVAARTTKIRLGTGILLMPLHDPIRVAEDGAVLDLISGGRFILGLGQGYRPEEFAGFGRRLEDRRQLMREGTTLVRRFWTETEVTFKGTHFSVEGVNVTPKPAQQPNPPIWIGAKKRRAVELAAEIGDGWYADPITPINIIRDNKVHWQTALKENGKDQDKQDFAYYREFYVGQDESTAREVGRRAVEGEYQGYLAMNHLTDDAGQPIPPDRGDLVADLVRKRCTIGDPERCIEDLQMINETLQPTHIILKMKYGGLAHEDVMAGIRLAAEKVLPHV